jgi:WD40 repeat protein
MKTVWSIAFSPDGQHIVSGSAENLVKVCSVSGGKELRRWLDTRILFFGSPSVLMGNMLSLEVETSWSRCGLLLVSLPRLFAFRIYQHDYDREMYQRENASPFG